MLGVLLSVSFSILQLLIMPVTGYSVSSRVQGVLFFMTSVCVYGLYSKYGISSEGFILYFAAATMMSVSVIDMNYQVVPNECVLMLLALGGGFVLVNFSSYQQLLLGGVISFLFFFGIGALTGAVGGGDIKLAGVLGLFFGLGSVIKFIALAFLFGAILGYLLITFRGFDKKEEFPFGQSLVGAAMIILLFG